MQEFYESLYDGGMVAIVLFVVLWLFFTLLDKIAKVVYKRRTK